MKRLILFLKKYMWPFKQKIAEEVDNRTFWQKAHEKVAKMVWHRAGDRRTLLYRNMPKHQRCLECQATSKRTNKVASGAWYHCRTHGEFLISC